MVRAGHLLIQTRASLISAGTERMLVEFGRGGLIAKARSQPEKVKQVLDKIRTDGLLPTLEAVFSRLDEPLPLGYCNVGRVVEIGAGVEGFVVGDRVASNGAHAEMVAVPATLAARVPDEVDDASASFTVLGSVALHGIRLMQPALGERVVVYGLGLLGLMAAQLLRAHGCGVLGIDINPRRCELARKFGCEAVAAGEGADPVRAAETFSQGRGVDGVLITASAKTDEIVHQSAQMCRKRGRIVLVGVVGLDLKRSDFYEKELSFQVSCSYGPGRYDPSYEDMNRDYPLPYVRWTEGRNFEAMLGAMAERRIDLRPLITREIAHSEAAQAYDAILNDPAVLGIVLQYPESPAPLTRTIVLSPPGSRRSDPTRPAVGVIGSGNFTKQVLLPAIQAAGGALVSVGSAGGVTSLHAGRKFEAEEATTDYKTILQNPQINTVCITTRHNSHARMVAEALAAGKHVFVEKPLAIDEEGLRVVRDAFGVSHDRQLMVGFNRRFAPHSVEVKKLLAGRSQPIAVDIMVNAGEIPANHWLQDREVGGGRIIGEGCHFIDLLRFLVGHPIQTVQAVAFGRDSGSIPDDKVTISFTFADGSIGTIHYWSNGPRSYPKERVEIFSEGRAVTIDNWRQLQVHNWPSAKRMKLRQDKGHNAELAAFLDRVRTGGEPLIPFEELDQVARASFAAVRAARENIVVPLSNATPESSSSVS